MGNCSSNLLASLFSMKYEGKITCRKWGQRSWREWAKYLLMPSMSYRNGLKSERTMSSSEWAVLRAKDWTAEQPQSACLRWSREGRF
jgi:hypothetical protein